MRFGRTKDQAMRDWREARHRSNMGWETFAWVPVQLHDGSWLWLERYVAATGLDQDGGGYKRIRFPRNSPELEAHRSWAKRHAERYFW